MFKNQIRTIIYTIPFVAFIALSAFAPKEQVYEGGKELYEKKCARCHGNDGTRGLFGAKNLRISRLDDEGYMQVITSGRNNMPSWSKKLSPGQINLVVAYIKEFRK